MDLVITLKDVLVVDESEEDNGLFEHGFDFVGRLAFESLFEVVIDEE